MKHNGRYVIVPIHFELLTEMVTQGYKIGHNGCVECIEGIPVDAQCVGSFTDDDARIWLPRL